VDEVAEYDWTRLPRNINLLGVNMRHEYPTPITDRLAACGVKYNKLGRIVCIQGSRDKSTYEISPRSLSVRLT